MLYLLDANVLITANAQYYEIGRVPEFWAWLQHQGTGGSVRIPKEIYEEITVGRGDLPAWLKQTDVKSALLLPEDVDPADVAEVINLGYAPDLTDDEIEQLGRDPFLIAYARVDAAQRCVVTTGYLAPGPSGRTGECQTCAPRSA